MDLSTYKRSLSATQNAADIVIGRPTQGMDALEVQEDRYDGNGLVFQAQDTNPDYDGTVPLPPACGNIGASTTTKATTRLSMELRDEHRRGGPTNTWLLP